MKSQSQIIFNTAFFFFSFRNCSQQKKACECLYKPFSMCSYLYVTCIKMKYDCEFLFLYFSRLILFYFFFTIVYYNIFRGSKHMGVHGPSLYFDGPSPWTTEGVHGTGCRLKVQMCNSRIYPYLNHRREFF